MKLTFEAPMKLVLHSKRLRLMTPDNLVATVEGIGREFQQNHGERLAACWNACHGLPIPPDVPPGALAALVAAADKCRTHVTPGALAGLRAALAPFTADPAPPVSPPAGPTLEDIQKHGCTVYHKDPETGECVKLGSVPPAPPVSPPAPDDTLTEILDCLRGVYGVALAYQRHPAAGSANAALFARVDKVLDQFIR